mmetsp:Transcript_19820/g.29381  ORF Transcript_19820/g.29381 Transcript_19820/m.29381 type:complete len:991 (-) Transcript_19820:75-3047(-)
MAPYEAYIPAESGSFQPDRYTQPAIVKFVRGLPRYGHSKNIISVLSNDSGKDSYVQGIVISSCVLLIIFLAWCLILIFLKLYTSGWASGSLAPPPEPPRKFTRGKRDRHNNDHDNSDSEDEETSSTSHSSGERSHRSGVSIDSSVFYNDPEEDEDLTMAVIAREQRRDKILQRQKQRTPKDFSSTTNGETTLVTAKDKYRSSGDRFCVYVPHSLRLALLRTYHDCLIHPDDENNPEEMIYDYFTWRGIRRDADNYIRRYHEVMAHGDNAAIVIHGDEDSDEDSLDDNTPITLDVIAREQADDVDLKKMMERVPNVFSTAANGSVQLITARGKDKKYRIVIPKSLQAKVMKTYHDCLCNPTEENNFDKVLYVHFTWNGIHRDVADYARNEGLTDEMIDRRGVRRKKSKKDSKPRRRCSNDSDYSNEDLLGSRLTLRSGGSQYSSVEEESESTQPIGLDEIAREQKKDRELRQLKKEEPFVFSTVRYGNTLLTTAQNFRDNKYRIVIPYSLQGRMLQTYRDCLMNPTPDRNFDTLLYNHFTWNGIHDDVDYFVKHSGRVPKKDGEERNRSYSQLVAKKSAKGKGFKSSAKNESIRHNQGNDTEYLEWAQENKVFHQKLKKIRVWFLLSGFFLIISSILFFEQGVKRVFNSLDDAQAGLHVTEDTANQALEITHEYFETQSNVQETARMIGTYEVSQWCPALPTDLDDFSQDVRNATYQIGIQFRDTAIQVETEVKGIQNDIEGLLVTVQDADATLEDFKRYIGAAKVLVILIDIVALSLMLACILAWTETQHYVTICFRNSFIIPIFVVLIILFWIFSTASLLGAMAGSDFCRMPDESATALVLGRQESLSPLVLAFLLYYITGCLPDRVPPKLETLSNAISHTGNFLHSQISNLVSNTKDFLAERCGETGPSDLVSALELTDVAMHGVYDILLEVRQLMQCQHFNPIYTSTTYDAVCISGVGGLSWVFFTSLAMGIFSMTMVTMRIAITQY